MPTKLETIKKQARAAAKEKGHDLKPFDKMVHEEGKSGCKECSLVVAVRVNAVPAIWWSGEPDPKGLTVCPGSVANQKYAEAKEKPDQHVAYIDVPIPGKYPLGGAMAQSFMDGAEACRLGHDRPPTSHHLPEWFEGYDAQAQKDRHGGTPNQLIEPARDHRKVDIGKPLTIRNAEGMVRAAAELCPIGTATNTKAAERLRRALAVYRYAVRIEFLAEMQFAEDGAGVSARMAYNAAIDDLALGERLHKASKKYMASLPKGVSNHGTEGKMPEHYTAQEADAFRSGVRAAQLGMRPPGILVFPDAWKAGYESIAPGELPPDGRKFCEALGCVVTLDVDDKRHRCSEHPENSDFQFVQCEESGCQIMVNKDRGPRCYNHRNKNSANENRSSAHDYQWPYEMPSPPTQSSDKSHKESNKRISTADLLSEGAKAAARKKGR